MTVKELMEELENFKQEANIKFFSYDSRGIHFVDTKDIEHDSNYHFFNKDKHIRMIFEGGGASFLKKTNER